MATVISAVEQLPVTVQRGSRSCAHSITGLDTSLSNRTYASSDANFIILLPNLKMTRHDT